MLEAADFQIGWERSKLYYPILMEKAAGHVLSSLDYDQPETLDAFRSVGKSLGYLHYFTSENADEPFNQWSNVSHGDLHTGNVVFDPSDHSVSFIDNGNIGFQGGGIMISLN